MTNGFLLYSSGDRYIIVLGCGIIFVTTMKIKRLLQCLLYTNA